MPADLRLPHLDPRQYFDAAELRRTARFERFLRLDWVGAKAAELAALGVLAVRGPRIARALAFGRVGTGVMLGVLSLAIVWGVRLPFGLAEQWWERRYGISRAGYLAWVVQPWGSLAGSVVLASIAIAIVMLLAAQLPRTWWAIAAPVFVGLGFLVVLLSPLVPSGLRPLRNPTLAAEAHALAQREGAGTTPVKVQKVRSTTTVANAEAVGVGPTTRVILWDTLLDGRFSRGEVAVVIAHEFAHVVRRHVWKGLAWFALIAFPGMFAVAQATRARGGIAEPGTVPLALLLLVVLQLALLPAVNVVARRYESEADWLALQTTRDPASARRLFVDFSRTGLAQPSPPTWSYLVLDTHPTPIQRISMAEAWRRLHR